MSTFGTPGSVGYRPVIKSSTDHLNEAGRNGRPGDQDGPVRRVRPGRPRPWPAAGGSSCWTCWPTASAPWRPWPARSACRWPTPASTCRSCARPAWSPPAVRAPRSITGWPRRRCSSCGGPCGPWPPAGWPRSSASPPPTSAPATSWSRSPARSWPAGSRTATTWSCWTCGRPPSTPPGTCPGRSRSRSASCAAGWPSCRATGRSSPTAAAPTAPSPTRPWPCCARRASRPDGWRTGCRNGRPPGWPSPDA